MILYLIPIQLLFHRQFDPKLLKCGFVFANVILLGGDCVYCCCFGGRPRIQDKQISNNNYFNVNLLFVSVDITSNVNTSKRELPAMPKYS